jgi:hypothetical protein
LEFHFQNKNQSFLWKRSLLDSWLNFLQLLKKFRHASRFKCSQTFCFFLTWWFLFLFWAHATVRLWGNSKGRQTKHLVFLCRGMFFLVSFFLPSLFFSVWEMFLKWVLLITSRFGLGKKICFFSLFCLFCWVIPGVGKNFVWFFYALKKKKKIIFLFFLCASLRSEKSYCFRTTKQDKKQDLKNEPFLFLVTKVN